MNQIVMNKKKKKRVFITIALCTFVAVAGFFAIPKMTKGDSDKYIVKDYYNTTNLLKDYNTLEKSQMSELARKTVVLISESPIEDKTAVKVEQNGLMTTLSYATTKQAIEAYEKFSKDKSILSCEYDQTVSMQEIGTTPAGTILPGTMPLEEKVLNESPQEDTHSTENLNQTPIKEAESKKITTYATVNDILMASIKEETNAKIYDKIASGLKEKTETKIPTIVVIDSGYNGKTDYGYNAMTGSNDITDTNGHGSLMVDIIKSRMGKTPYQLAVIKIANDNGLATTSSIIKALEYAATLNPTVINMSFTTTDTSQSKMMQSYVDKFTEHNVAVICSAGNDGKDTKNYIPASFSFAIVVGSCDASGKKKSFSNYGKTVDFNIVSDSTSEAAAKATSMFAIAYATDTYVKEVINSSGEVFDTEENNYPLDDDREDYDTYSNTGFAWCLSWYYGPSPSALLGKGIDVDALNFAIRQGYSYKGSFVIPTAITATSVAGILPSGGVYTFPAGTKMYIGYNCKWGNDHEQPFIIHHDVAYMCVGTSLTTKGCTSKHSSVDGTGCGWWKLKNLQPIIEPPASLQTVYYRTQNADGGYSGYSLLIQQNYLNGATLSWQRPADVPYKYSSISYVVNGPSTHYVNIDRQIYTQLIYVRYQDENGNYGGWSVGLNANYFYEAPVNWSFAGDAIYNPASFSYTAYGANTNYVNITRKQFTLGLNKDVGIDATTGAGTYYVGQTVTINATPKDGYLFDYWKNDTNGVQTATNPQTFVIPGANQSYTAASKKIQRNVSVSLFIEDRDGVSTKTTDSNLATFSFNGFSDLVYLNQAYDWDIPFTLNATVKDPINYRIKRIDMGTPPVTIVNGETNNIGTSRTPQEINIYIEKLVGSLATPALTVSNPWAHGVYYDRTNNLYYLKADGRTPINLRGTCVLNPVNYSRIDKVILTNLYGTYQLKVPRSDITSGKFTKETIQKTETFSRFSYRSIIYPVGEPTIGTYNKSTLNFTQDFIATGEEKRKFEIRSYASSIEDTYDSHRILATGDELLAIQGDRTEPSVNLVIKDSLRDKTVPMDSFDIDWTNAKTLKFQLSDLGSGIKSYTLSKNGEIISSKSYKFYDDRITDESFTINTIEGESVYRLTVVDNVWNTTSYDFTLKVDQTKPSITDTDTAFGASNVKAADDSWPKTNVDATWSYNWTKEKLLSYLAEDNFGIRNLNIHNYGPDATYKIESELSPQTITTNDATSVEFENTTGILNGRSYLKLEAEDLAGNKTTVNVVVRTDNQMSIISNFYANSVDLENYTIEELNTMFSNGELPDFKTKIQFKINENFSTDDTSGIQKVEVLCKDPITNAEIKTYDVTSQIDDVDVTCRIDDVVKTKESASDLSPLAPFAPSIRNLSGSYDVDINTLEEMDLSTYSTLNISIRTTDYAGNIAEVAESESQPIANYGIKSVIYSTKEKAYNLPLNDGKSNVAYFKTGEVGFIEVWTVGYVDKLELDFSNQDIGKVANAAIANKQLLPKYILGVKNAGMVNKRYVTTVKDFKVTSSVPDKDGVSFLSHIKYTSDEVNQSVGDFGINGWAEKGTMIRIPPSLTLTPKTKMIDGKEVGIKDKDGNQLYHWKNCIASVYAFKNNVEGPIPSSCQYTIWDESGDDIHYRVIHQMLKK